MLNPVCFEVHSINFHCLRQRYDAAIANREAHQQAPRLASGVDRAWCAFAKPSGMIEVGMCEHDCSRRNSAQPAKPICPTIDHDAGVVVFNQQCTVALMPTRVYPDLTPCAEKLEFEHVVFAAAFAAR